MKRDKKFVFCIVFISIAITSILQYMRSPEAPKIVPYLNALESSLCVFGKEGYTNEFYSFNSQLKPGIEQDVIPVEYFVEEQRVIEEFTNQKRIKPFLYRDEPADYISFYLSLINNMNVKNDIPTSDLKREDLCNKIIPVGYQQAKKENNSQGFTHKIKANDNLYNLAKKYYNDVSKWIIIYQANKNRVPDPHSLKIGQEILIPNITVPI